ncbi:MULTISPECIES: ATP-binding protein [Flavobacteriaceae]|uniref:histidine kinase n=1 Tax=Lutibacter litoralis TaxID=321268 RepID=A0ABV5K1I0_9FLAO|nr:MULTISPECIES: triple tyrosine motif-containing protein [Flavobacteriaceae]
MNGVTANKKEIHVENQDSLIKIAAENLKLNFEKVSWYNSSKKSTSIIFFENDFTGIKLPYNNAFVKFEFATTNFPITTNCKFKYKLRGLYSSWITLEKTNEVIFTHLPPGAYNLEIVYSTNEDNWKMKTMGIPIIVDQVYYKRWWFVVISICCFVLLLFFIRKYELNHLKKMEALKMKISRDLHDELGSALTGIAIKSDLLLEQIDNKSKKEFLSEIAEESRCAVDALSDIVWVIDSSNNSIQNLSDRMESILYQYLTPLNIEITFQSLQTKKQILINQDCRQHVFLIFKEAITNIMKHSNATKVFVSITKNRKNLKLTIKDNGTRITNKFSTLNGNGIKNMKLRVEKIHGEIQFYYNKGFTIELLFNYLNK